MPYTLIVDIAVAVLLVVTIGYAITLNKRLNRLRRDKKDLETLEIGRASCRERV